jgi:RNA polymerase sigma-70 factor (ECF subfamily)
MNRDGAVITPDALLDQARRGDAAALGQLFALHRAYLVALARPQLERRLRGKVDASDVAQEALLEAHRCFKSFRGGCPAEFAGWLRGILAHLIARNVRRYYEAQRRDAGLERSLGMELDNASSMYDRALQDLDDSPSELAGQREANLLLYEAVESLPADYRQVIVRRHFEGAPFADIAAGMERSVDSVEKLWVRALARLRREMGATHVGRSGS